MQDRTEKNRIETIREAGVKREKGFRRAAEKIDMITVAETFCSGDVSVYAYIDKEEKYGQNGEPVTEYRFDRIREENGKAGKGERGSITAVPGGDFDAFMKRAERAGIMIAGEDAEGNGRYYTFTDSAMKSLCEKFGIPGVDDWNDENRNRMIARRFFSDRPIQGRKKRAGVPSIEELAFITRYVCSASDGTVSAGMITGVTTSCFQGSAVTPVLDMLDDVKRANAIGEACVRDWSVTEETATLEIVFPDREREYPFMGKDVVRLMPGIRITNSDCGRSSWRMQSIIVSGEDTAVLKEELKQHNSVFNPVKYGRKWLCGPLAKSIDDFFAAMESEGSLVIKDFGDTDAYKARIMSAVAEREEVINGCIGKKRGKVFRRLAAKELSRSQECTGLDIALVFLSVNSTLGRYRDVKKLGDTDRGKLERMIPRIIGMAREG